VDCSIIEGYRGPVRQNKMVEDGLSRLHYPNGKHNQTPSLAVDAAPYPIDWNDNEKFYWFGGYVLGAADSLGLEIRWGGDWDSDMDFKDQTLVDLVHFEIGE
jgi:peptidoglycan L-alanyl-D-glutamate endopeptidase CwlK